MSNSKVRRTNNRKRLAHRKAKEDQNIMSNTFKTQEAKDAAIAKQQAIVDAAKPSTSAEAKEELAELKSATVTD